MIKKKSLLSYWWNKLRTPWRNYRHAKRLLHWIPQSLLNPIPPLDSRHLVIIRLDDIGDYLLFRNCLPEYQNIYPDFTITLIGNQVWKELAETWDLKYVHHFIWVDKSKFRKDISYRNSIFSSLATLTADTVIAPAYCRDVFLEDSIAAVIPAKHKWAWDQKDYLPWKKKFQEKVFTQLIPDTDIPIFMGEINLAFMNRVGMKESKFINKLGFPLNSEKPINPYIVVFPGAGARQKMWAINNYIEIIHKLVETPFRIKICGGPGDLALGERIQREFINTNRVENLCGKTNLVELGNLLGNASLIITNDTSAAHFAGIAKTKVIVILNGNNYGAFFPYPRDYTNVNCIYPPDIANELNAHAYLHWKGAGEMNWISVNQVWEKIIEELITL